MKFFAVFACVLVVANAQYAPSGWKPQGARLTLPTEYGAPGQPEAQPQDLEVEITKENLEFVGQLGETTTEQINEESTTTEIPEEAPTQTEEPLVGQELPEENNFHTFRQPEPVKRVGQLRRIPARFQQQRFARVEEQPQIYGPPETPATTVEPESEQVTDEIAVNDREVEEVEGDSDSVNPSIAVANSGQYYVLAPDNTLQKVTFYTRQTEDDRRTNGFTAELRYAPVQPIRDPIYAYNEQGQLVQVYNK